jgi:hypothetical protein
VGELIDLASSYLERRPPPVMAPSLYRRVVHPLLARRAEGKRRRALRNIETFFPYFSMRVRYDDARARRALAEHRIEVPRLPSYFDRLMDFALSADWGRSQLPRHEVMPSRPRRRPAPRRRGASREHERAQLHSLTPGA